MNFNMSLFHAGGGVRSDFGSKFVHFLLVPLGRKQGFVNPVLIVLSTVDKAKN